jgi:glycosyltransferase involved in cell wall biosynthesis
VAGNPVKVLHLRDSPWVDGPGRTILESATHFDPLRVEYHIGVFKSPSTTQHPLLEAARECGARVHQIEDHGGFDRRVVGQISQLVADLEIDVLHTSELRSRVYGWLCQRRQPRLIGVTTLHGWIANSWRRKVMRFCDKALLRNFDSVIMVSEAMRRLVPRWWLPASSLVVIHNALAIDRYGKEHVDAARRRTDVSGRVVALNVGRLSPEKGQDLLLHAFAEVGAQHPGFQLWFAGTGPLESELRALAVKLGVAGRVRFLGFVADMPALYREVDVVVQSSLTEGLPNVILEAVYLRVPIIATAVGGTAEVVEHGSGGWLIDRGSAQQLASALRLFLTEPERFARMAGAGHNRIHEQFSFTARTEKLTRLYEELRQRR